MTWDSNAYENCSILDMKEHLVQRNAREETAGMDEAQDLVH